MKRLRRAGLAAGVAVVVAVLGSGSSSATISPDPYSTTTATGSITSRSILGTLTCGLSSVSVILAGAPLGASGNIPSLTPSTCTGIAMGASATLVTGAAPAWLAIAGASPGSAQGTATLRDARVLFTLNGMIARCLYGGTLTGSVANGSAAITVRNPAARLVATLSGVCTASQDVSMTISTAATITW
ncbi:hemagluttinin family protein [Conexibacter woesei DSM 14684]|uniref:Hemagluttinin family protein n=1 Tax=Conexibacter woesei (strain DSM 14684 / CCUG 47730 / CIP 108061 / JCM 11494 / NBRC 100937 / ID131577) TaxID=469383 RepID=D3F8P8_CONWI|nr:hemagluttinin family protein [Conexibacter woesei DSM 14684]